MSDAIDMRQSGTYDDAWGRVACDAAWPNRQVPPLARRFRAAADAVWRDGYGQPFVQELGAGTLARERFAFYLLQDFRYLREYAKVHALVVAKTDDPQIAEHMVRVQRQIIEVETSVHRAYMASYGVSREQMDQVRQSAFARAYTSNILAIAYARPVVDVLVAVLPCAWVYADYGVRLARQFADRLPDNPYRSWIDMYASDEFWDSTVWLVEQIERLAASLDESRLRELEEIFVTGVEHEVMFWQSAYAMHYSWKPQWDDALGYEPFALGPACS